METNTVILDLKEYLKMRDFKKKIKEGKVAIIKNGGWFDYGNESGYYTDSEVVADFEADIKDLKKKIIELRHPDKKGLSIDELKSMNWWQFRKWKRANK